MNKTKYLKRLVRRLSKALDKNPKVSAEESEVLRDKYFAAQDAVVTHRSLNGWKQPSDDDETQALIDACCVAQSDYLDRNQHHETLKEAYANANNRLWYAKLDEEGRAYFNADC